MRDNLNNWLTNFASLIETCCEPSKLESRYVGMGWKFQAQSNLLRVGMV